MVPGLMWDGAGMGGGYSAADALQPDRWRKENTDVTGFQAVYGWPVSGAALAALVGLARHCGGTGAGAREALGGGGGRCVCEQRPGPLASNPAEPQQRLAYQRRGPGRCGR